MFGPSKRQHIIATFIHEPEYHALVAGLSRASYFEAKVQFFGYPVPRGASADSSATRGRPEEEEVGRMKHSPTRVLGGQQMIERLAATLCAVFSAENHAESGTRSVPRPRLQVLRELWRLVPPATDVRAVAWATQDGVSALQDLVRCFEQAVTAPMRRVRPACLDGSEEQPP